MPTSYINQRFAELEAVDWSFNCHPSQLIRLVTVIIELINIAVNIRKFTYYEDRSKNIRKRTKIVLVV